MSDHFSFVQPRLRSNDTFKFVLGKLKYFETSSLHLPWQFLKYTRHHPSTIVTNGKPRAKLPLFPKIIHIQIPKPNF